MSPTWEEHVFRALVLMESHCEPYAVLQSRRSRCFLLLLHQGIVIPFLFLPLSYNTGVFEYGDRNAKGRACRTCTNHLLLHSFLHSIDSQTRECLLCARGAEG